MRGSRRPPARLALAADLLWARAKAGTLRSSDLELCKEYQAFSRNDLQRVLWAVGTLRSSQQPLIADLACELLRTSRQGLGNVFWVLATTGALGQVRDLERHALRHLAFAKPRDLAGMAWACAVSSSRGCLSAVLARSCEERGREMSARELANATWAFAKMGEPCRVSKWLRRRHFELQAAEVAGLLWAAAKTQEAMGLESRALSFKTWELSSQEVASFIWAMAKLSSLTDGLFPMVLEKQSELQARHMANMLWALASTRLYCEPLLGLSGRALQHPDVKHVELVTLAWSCARLDHIPVSWLDSAPAHSRCLIPRYFSDFKGCMAHVWLSGWHRALCGGVSVTGADEPGLLQSALVLCALAAWLGKSSREHRGPYPCTGTAS